MMYSRRRLLVLLGCTPALGLSPPELWPWRHRRDEQRLIALDERIRVEFARGDIVQIGGWVLSRTEARLCAPYG